MSLQKIKTLKQAEEYIKTNPNQKVQKVVDLYHQTHAKVFADMSDENSYIDFTTNAVSFDHRHPLKYYWATPSLVEIIGQKGTGKTALALKFALEYVSCNPEAVVKILNCGGGITSSRLSPFRTLNYQYIDIFTSEDIQEVLGSLRNGKEIGLVVLDSVYSILMGASQRIGLGDYLTSLKAKGWTIIVTNLLQGKL